MPNSIVVIEAATREGLAVVFGSRSKYLTWEQVQRRFDALLQHGYAETRSGPDGKWLFVLKGKPHPSSP
jgi:hypothetical protein